MPRTVLAVLAIAAVLGTVTPAAAEVFVTKDAQGRPIYTDRPDRLPAEKLNVATKRTDVVEVQSRYQEQQKASAEADKAATDGARQAQDARQATQSNAADKARRCQEARDRYQTVMTSQRLYVQGTTPDERRYLTSEEIDTARADAKKLMDEFCAAP
jgi:phage-related minor tail protein